MKRIMELIIVKVLVVAVMVWFGLRWFERSNLYFPDRQLVATPAQVGMPFEEVWLTASDGVKIHGWYISKRPGGQPAAPTILFSHGNAGNISHRLDKAARLLQTGADVFLFDYRGYGRSRGRPSESGAYRDAEAVYRYLADSRQLPADRIVLYGESLGAAVAVETATRFPVGGLILEAPFTSTVGMAKLVFPFLPVRWMVREKYDNLAKIPKLKVPLLILHSPQDDIVPFRMGQALYEAAHEPKRLVELIGDHNEGYVDSGEAYPKAITEFFASVGAKR